MTKGLWEYKDEEWEILYLDPKEIKGVSKYNARKQYPDKELDEIVISYKELGINTRPIILDENNEVIEGNRRYRAALEANLPRLWCLRKPMSSKEKRIRSFIENELQYDITDKDRYIFAKELKENEGMTNTEIAFATGRDVSTIGRWLAYPSLPEVIKETDVAEVFTEQSPRKKKYLRSTLDSPVFKEKNPDAAIEYVKQAPELSTRTVEDISKEVKIGALDTYPKEKIQEYVEIEDKIDKDPSSYPMFHLRLHIKLANLLATIFKFDYPRTPFKECIVKVLEDYANKRSKELGLMR